MSTLLTTTVATRPTSNRNTGDLYFETDTNKLIMWDGSDWEEFSSAGPFAPQGDGSPHSITAVTVNEGSGTGNEEGSPYVAGSMELTLSNDWPSTSSGDTGNLPYFELPAAWGNSGEQINMPDSDYDGNNLGWVDGSGGGQNYPFGGRIYSLTDRSPSGEADFDELLSDTDSHLGSAIGYPSNMESHVSGWSTTFFSTFAPIYDSNSGSYTAFGNNQYYDNNNSITYYGFQVLTWTHGDSTADIRVIYSDQGSAWYSHVLWTLNLGTVPAYSSSNPVSINPASVIVRDMGGVGNGDSTHTFATGSEPTFTLTPAVFTP